MLIKTQTVERFPAPWKAGRRMNGLMRACSAWLTIEEHDKILDMACGEGALLEQLNNRYRLTVCGMCDAPEQARAVRQILGDADVIPGNMEDIPWRDHTFDAVVLAGPMKGDHRRVLAEAARVLRIGGQFVMGVPLLRMGNEGELSKRELMRLFQEAGFRDVSFHLNGMNGAVVGWKKEPAEA